MSASLRDGILLLPIVGIIDSKRAQNIMDAMLGEIRTTATLRDALVFAFRTTGVELGEASRRMQPFAALPPLSESSEHGQ